MTPELQAFWKIKLSEPYHSLFVQSICSSPFWEKTIIYTTVARLIKEVGKNSPKIF